MMSKIPLPPPKPPSTTARYDSKCPCCGEDIYEGDLIYLVEGEWICEPCYIGQDWE